MQTVQSSVRYTTEAFVQELNQFLAGQEDLDCVVATLPSYHHLKKAIFELRKNEHFTARCDIRFVLTKVLSSNFFMNESRNCYQFLIENCMKGVSQAVLFERKDTTQADFDI